MAQVRFSFKLNVHGQRPGTPFQTFLDEACLAEDLGFHGVYVIDHMYLPTDRLAGYTNADPEVPYFLDCWTTLAAVATVTKRVRLGPQVTPIGLRHPAFVAKWGATVDQISAGRLDLGVGLGHQEVEYSSYGFDYPPFKARYQRMLEGVEIIHRLWTEREPLTFEGNHYQIRDVSFWPKPVQNPRPPFWFGGTSPSIQRAVARWGDGWAPAAPQAGGLDVDFYRNSIESIRESARAQGRIESVGAGALFYIAISEDRGSLDRVVEMLRRRKDWEALPREDLTERGPIVMGTPEEVVVALKRYATAGVEHFTLGFVPLDDHEAIRKGMLLFADKVLPAFA